MRRLLGILVPALFGAAVLAGCTDFKITPSKKVQPVPEAGMYTITSPQKEIILLDTATGKTWVLTYDQGVARWTPIDMEGDGVTIPESAIPESKAPESKPAESKPPASMVPESKAPESKAPADKPAEKPPAAKTPEKPPAPKDNTAIDNAAKPKEPGRKEPGRS